MTGPKPRFIALEGIDGSGTTTALERLRVALTERGALVHVTCEPSGLPLGRLLRQVLGHHLVDDAAAPVHLSDPTVALLFAADRLDHIAREIEPALAAGRTVLTDRYLLSSLAYQGALCGLDWVAAINSRARQPDLTLVFDLPVEEAAARRTGRGGQVERFEVDEVQRQVADAYRQLAAEQPGVLVVDASQGPADVAAACLDHILAL